MASRLQLAAKLTDMDSTLPYMQDNLGRDIVLRHFTDWGLGCHLDQAGSVRVGATFAEHFTAAILAAFDGPGYKKPNKSIMVTLFRDGGTVPVSYALVTHVEIALGGPQRGIVLDLKDLWQGFTETHLDHESFDGTALSTILQAAPGTISVRTGGTSAQGVVIRPEYFPSRRGLQSSVPGRQNQPQHARMAFQIVPDPLISAAKISADIYSDGIANGLTTLLRAAAGSFNPDDPAPLGARAHYSIDIAHRTCRAGYLGQTAKTILTNKLDNRTLDQTTHTPVYVDGIKLTISKEQQKGQADLRGAHSQHGLPANAQFTGLAILNTDRGPLSTLWDDNVCLVGVATGNDGGGVFLYLHSNTLYRVSPVMDVFSMCQAGNDIYIATKTGVKLRPGSKGTPIPNADDAQEGWDPLGKLNQPVDKIWFHDGVHALVTKAGSGANGVYTSPQVGGEPSTASQGYAGWSRIANGGAITDAAGTADALYFIDQTHIATLYFRDSAGNLTVLAKTPGDELGSTVNGLDDRGGVVVRLANGRFMVPTTSGPRKLLDLDGDNTMADAFSVLLPTFVCLAQNPVINGHTYRYYAMTDRGLWGSLVPSKSLVGGNWVKLSAESGLADLQATDMVVGSPQTVLNRPVQRLYAISDRSFYVSNSGGVWWFDLMAQPLDLGPFWYALAAQCGELPWPDNQVGALGSIAGATAAIDPGTHPPPNPSAGSLSGVPSGAPGTSPTTPPIGTPVYPEIRAVAEPGLVDIGGAGRLVPIPFGNPRVLPPDMLWARRLTGHNDFSYRMVIANTSAPYNAIAEGEMSEITSDDTRGDVAAAEQLAQVVFYYMQEAQQTPVQISVPYSYTIVEAAIATVLPQDRVALDIHYVHPITAIAEGDPVEYLTVLDLPPTDAWYCLANTENGAGGGAMKGVVDLGNLLVMADLTFQELVAGVANGQTRDKRYRRVH